MLRLGRILEDFESVEGYDNIDFNCFRIDNIDNIWTVKKIKVITRGRKNILIVNHKLIIKNSINLSIFRIITDYLFSFINSYPRKARQIWRRNSRHHIRVPITEHEVYIGKQWRRTRIVENKDMLRKGNKWYDTFTKRK